MFVRINKNHSAVREVDKRIAGYSCPRDDACLTIFPVELSLRRVEGVASDRHDCCSRGQFVTPCPFVTIFPMPPPRDIFLAPSTRGFLGGQRATRQSSQFR